MCVVVEFGCGEGTRVESHEVDFTRVELDGENCSQSIVGSIGLGLSGIQCVRIGAVVKVVLRDWKAFLAASQKSNFIPFRVRHVNGTTIFEYSEMKRR